MIISLERILDIYLDIDISTIDFYADKFIEIISQLNFNQKVLSFHSSNNNDYSPLS